MKDMALLRDYAHTQSEWVFTELVKRHIGLVYAQRRFANCAMRIWLKT